LHKHSKCAALTDAARPFIIVIVDVIVLQQPAAAAAAELVRIE